MSQFYFDQSREHEKYTLPDGEVFWVDAGEWWYDEHGERCDEPGCLCPQCEGDMVWSDTESDFACSDCKRNAEAKETPCGAGFYWWACLPGCMPDSEPNGPFATEEEALANAREGYES